MSILEKVNIWKISNIRSYFKFNNSVIRNIKGLSHRNLSLKAKFPNMEFPGSILSSLI